MTINRQEILDLYRGLRVTDVIDGMDAIGLQDTGTMSPDIHPLWRDMETFKHCFTGFAMTVRFMPSNRALHAKDIEDYRRKKSEWYARCSEDEVYQYMQPGDVLVIDGDVGRDIGYMGSMNAYAHILNGFVGIVTNGTCRDSDELIKQQVPIHFRVPGRGIRPGRLEYDCCNVPVNVGGVLVRPGDLVVADGDGAVVVPIEHACAVGAFSRSVADEDKAARRELYRKAGRPLDFTCS